MEQINWMEPKKDFTKHDKEVRVSTSQWKGKPYTVISFYNGANLKVTKGDRIRVGVTSTRLYFDEAAKGYALSRSGSITRSCKLPGSREHMAGEYNLQFDAERKLWYVGV